MDKPVTLPCGAILRNRFVKAAMSESLADPYGRPDKRLQSLYRFWGNSGAAVLLTGNIQVDDCHLEDAGNMRIEQYWNDKKMREMYAKLAEVAQENGCHLWPQLSHAGRNADPKVRM